MQTMYAVLLDDAEVVQHSQHAVILSVLSQQVSAEQNSASQHM